MLDDFDPRLLPALHEVDFDELERATDDEPFVREGFELLKEASVLLLAVAGIRTDARRGGLPRDQAIVIGHYARMTKLALARVGAVLVTGCAPLLSLELSCTRRPRKPAVVRN